MLALVFIATSLADWRDLAPVHRLVSVALAGAALIALLLGWLAPPPWLHILLMTLLLGAVWLFGILTWFSVTHPDAAPPAEAGPGTGQWGDRGRDRTPRPRAGLMWVRCQLKTTGESVTGM